MQRQIISIDADKCTGCGDCLPNCPEGALQIIDGQARLVSDLLCDGLGACLGHCPEGAITLAEREAGPYDERQVVSAIVRQGPNTLRAHLTHLREHGQTEYYQQALAYLAEQQIPVPAATAPCPGSRAQTLAHPHPAAEAGGGPQPSQLTHWPVQMHLLSPQAPHYRGADMLLAADCVAYALGDFHQTYLQGKTLGIACPKLDEGQAVYVEKIQALIDEAEINTLTVMIMQVPCCRGLLQMAQQAARQARRQVPLKVIVVSLQGEILQSGWL
jgi:ferredoxin